MTPQQGVQHPRPNGYDAHEALLFSPITPITLSDGSGSGKIDITVDTVTTVASGENLALGYRVDGEIFSVQSDAGSQDIADAFDLSGETDLDADEYVKVLLVVDESGTFDHRMGEVTDQDHAPLPMPKDGEAVIGWLDVEGAVDWDADNISANATYHEGHPFAG